MPSQRIGANGASSSPISVAAALSLTSAGPIARRSPSIVRPGGLIMFTVPGERWIGLLDAADRDRFQRGEPVIVYPEQNGTNMCAALSPVRPSLL